MKCVIKVLGMTLGCGMLLSALPGCALAPGSTYYEPVPAASPGPGPGYSRACVPGTSHKIWVPAHVNANGEYVKGYWNCF